jgi:dipeptidyl aminopeptidase/acylaminoacyl peptidase
MALIAHPRTPLGALMLAAELLVAAGCAGLAGVRPASEAETRQAAPPPDVGDGQASDETPGPTSTPEPALPPDRFWIAVEGGGDALAAVSPGGEVEIVRLPLNEGQQATDVIAAPDGGSLAYLAWDADGAQLGIAVWRLDEPNARLIVRPEAGMRIIGLAFSGDEAGLAYVQVEQGRALAEAGWQVSVIPAGGGASTVVATPDTLAEMLAPVPLGWPVDGPLLLIPAVPGASAEGIFAVDTETATGSQLVPVEGRLIADPQLSPDGTQLAFLASDPAGDETPADGYAAKQVTIYDLRRGDLTTMEAPRGQEIYGVRWHPDGVRLLLDIVAPSPDDAGGLAQVWALVESGREPPWPGSPQGPGPGRDRLFDYVPYREGVAYTLLPDGEEWALYIVPDLVKGQEMNVVSLEAIAHPSGAPVIVHAPTS